MLVFLGLLLLEQELILLPRDLDHVLLVHELSRLLQILSQPVLFYQFFKVHLYYVFQVLLEIAVA